FPLLPRRKQPRGAPTQANALRTCEVPLDLGLEAPPAGEVRGAAQVAGEGCRRDRALVPGPRRLGRDAIGEVQDPARALAVELDELVDRVGRPEAPAQLGHGGVGDQLERRALTIGGRLEVAGPLLPL